VKHRGMESNAMKQVNNKTLDTPNASRSKLV